MAAAKCLLPLMLVLVVAGRLVCAQERIKMCGRELIRLAVSSCGNSRLRRSIMDLDMDLDLEQHLDTSPLNPDAVTHERQAAGWDQTSQDSDAFSLPPHWLPLYSRMRRASGKISDICCEKGCSMKELIQFC